MFVKALFKEEVKEEQSQYENANRWTKGQTDYPFSLMEGSSGAISLLADLLNGDVKFPGLEF
jgi:hypothetical protein